MKSVIEPTTINGAQDDVYRLTMRTLIYSTHDQIIAYALDTDLMGTGFDEEAAIENLRQTVRLFLEDAAMRGNPEDLMQRQAHTSFFDRWENPPYGVEAGYLSMTIRLTKRTGIAFEPPQALKCA